MGSIHINFEVPGVVDPNIRMHFAFGICVRVSRTLGTEPNRAGIELRADARHLDFTVEVLPSNANVEKYVRWSVDD